MLFKVTGAGNNKGKTVSFLQYLPDQTLNFLDSKGNTKKKTVKIALVESNGIAFKVQLSRLKGIVDGKLVPFVEPEMSIKQSSSNVFAGAPSGKDSVITYDYGSSDYGTSEYVQEYKNTYEQETTTKLEIVAPKDVTKQQEKIKKEFTEVYNKLYTSSDEEFIWNHSLLVSDFLENNNITKNRYKLFMIAYIYKNVNKGTMTVPDLLFDTPNQENFFRYFVSQGTIKNTKPVREYYTKVLSILDKPNKEKSDAVISKLMGLVDKKKLPKSTKVSLSRMIPLFSERDFSKDLNKTVAEYYIAYKKLLER
jgi:hypothetical protein